MRRQTKCAIPVFSTFVAILLSASSLPSPALGSANAAPVCGELCWSLTAPPSFTESTEGYGAAAPYHNGFNSSVDGTVYIVLHNQLGQTIGIDPTTTTVPPGGNATLNPGVFGLLPPGNYSAYVFATNGAGVAISNETFAGSLESTYSVRIVGTSTSSGPAGSIDLSFTIENVAPSPVTVNVTVIASDPNTNETIWRNQTEVTIPAVWTADVGPMLIGTGNLASCNVTVTIFMQDQNGKNLGWPAGASQECGPL